MEDDDPIEKAKRFTDKLTDLVIAAKAANENTRHAVYSSHLSDQVPRSHAANAILELKNTLLFYSVVRSCALFDKPANDRVSLHTDTRTLKNGKKVGKLARETYRNHATLAEPRRLTPEDDPEIKELLADHWMKHSKGRGRKEEQLVHRSVRAEKKWIVLTVH